MKRMMSGKSYSWWWDSHVSPKNSKWLSENLEQMDCLVKEMLKLIEEDGDSFAKKAEMYYRRRPELIAHVEDFYRMYRALAERYDNVTGELRKTIPSELQSQGSGSGSDFGTEQVSPSPEHTPERKLNLPLPNKRAAGFDIFLGSDFSGKGSGYSSSSSSSLESGSDSEDATGKVINANDNSKGLNERIIQLENDLHELRVKLLEYEIGSSGHCGHLVSTENLDIPNALASNTESEASNEMHPESEGRIVAFEAELSNHKSEIRSLNEAMVATAKQFEAEISNKNHTIEEYKTQLDEALKKFMQEKLTVEAELSNHKSENMSLNDAMVATAKQFEAEISSKNHTIEEYKTQLDEALKKFMQEKLTVEAELKNSIDNLKAEAEQLSKEKSLIEIRISEQEQVIKELRVMLTESSERFHHDKAELEGKVCSLLNSENNYAAKLQALEDKLSELEAEKTEACNESDGYKLRVDMLMAEKDELNARIGKLVNDAKSRDDSYHSIAEHLHQLHLEHVKLIKEIEDSKKAYVELINRVRELEEEVIKQRVLISDGAEGKREAIRQLCFSLEHYRDGYKQLRQVLLVQNRRHTIMAA